MIPDCAIAAVCWFLVISIASQNSLSTVVVFVMLPLLMLGMHLRSVKFRKKTRFFFWWSVVSLCFLLAVFELEVVPYLEILFTENFTLMCLVSVMCLCAYFTKSCTSSLTVSLSKEQYEGNAEQWPKCDTCSLHQPPRSRHCKLCGICILRQDHHCAWLDVCIGARNHRWFVCFLIAVIASCCYCANLTLTTVCHPVLFAGVFLVPDDCTDVYSDVHISICFVSALYILFVAAYAFLMLVFQSWLVAHNSTFSEWMNGQFGNYHNSFMCNCAEFWYGSR